MKKMMRVLFALLLVFGLSLSNIGNVFATTSGTYSFEYEELEEAIVTSLLATFINDQTSDDIDVLLTELKNIDPELGETWDNIMSYWDQAITTMTINTYNPSASEDPSGTYTPVSSDESLALPTDLVSDDSTLCIVVLGYSLNDDGSMKNELYGRLLTAYAIYQQYPDAMIAVTGGGTARNNSSATEAGQMADYLINTLGVDESKVIIEDEAKNTAGNAINTMTILSEQYPQIDSLLMVTSEYHIARGSTFFNSVAELYAYDTGIEYTIVGNLGFDTDTSTESVNSMRYGQMYTIADVSASSQSSSAYISLTDFTLLELSVTSLDVNQGEELVLPEGSVSATLGNSVTVDVTDYATISGYDETVAGEQTVLVSFSYNGITLSHELTVNVAAVEDSDDESTDQDGSSTDQDNSTTDESTTEDQTTDTTGSNETVTDTSSDTTDNTTDSTTASSTDTATTTAVTTGDISLLPYAILTLTSAGGIYTCTRKKIYKD